MSRKKVVLAIVVVALVGAVVATAALAGNGGQLGPSVRKQLAAARRATAKYHNVEVALANGYAPLSPCVEVPGLGAMGFHYGNFGLLGDGVVDIRTPEVLLYIPDGDGVRLVGVEYLMLALANTENGPAPWFEETPPPGGWFTRNPELFGQTFHGPMAGHGEGEPWHYELHVWIWEDNPSGIFADFNPSLSCNG